MKQVILFSGGLDSATLLYQLKRNGRGEILALFFDIGQKSVTREREAARSICAAAGIRLEAVCLRDVFKRSKSAMLIGGGKQITETIRVGNDIKYRSEDTEIEFRNGVLIAAAISLIVQLFPNEKVDINYGAIRTREHFADCTKEFIETCDRLAWFGNSGAIRVKAPLADKGKDEVWRLAKALGVPVELTWSCYDGGEQPCGICPACLDRRILEGQS